MAGDTPPAKAPYYNHGGWFRMGEDAPQFRIRGKFQFEFIDPDRGDPPELASVYYAGDFAERIAGEPLWQGDGGWAVRPDGASAVDGSHRVAFAAHNEAAGRTVEGALVFSPDPSGWIKVEVFLGPERVLLAYMDHVWEEFDLWPSGAAPDRDDEPPGHVGKRRNRVSLSVAAWPALRAITAEDYFWIGLPDL